jgi:thiol-disulfide isomerase/thioredoxin
MDDHARLPSFEGATGWLNREPVTAEDVKGKVVLVDFWTFTCINWIRTLPYTRSWAETYGPHGLVVVGVHTPEFTLEHDIGRVRRAARRMRVEHPIALDNDYAVWEAFANRYWPARYLADAGGNIRHHHFGEGGYEQTEDVLRRLLVDAGVTDLPDGRPVHPEGIEAPADWASVRSPETYLGVANSQGFASPGGAFLDEARAYSSPSRLITNQWALTGDWTIGKEEAVLNEPGGRVAYRFHARDLNLILAPPRDDTSARFRVSLDGRPPFEAHGLDVDHDGNGTVSDARLYQLIRQPGKISDRLFEIELLDPGVAALCFTFG